MARVFVWAEKRKKGRRKEEERLLIISSSETHMVIFFFFFLLKRWKEKERKNGCKVVNVFIKREQRPGVWSTARFLHQRSALVFVINVMIIARLPKRKGIKAALSDWCLQANGGGSHRWLLGENIGEERGLRAFPSAPINVVRTLCSPMQRKSFITKTASFFLHLLSFLFWGQASGNPSRSPRQSCQKRD